jgi:pyridoxal phosphate enzyme (YggS family)
MVRSQEISRNLSRVEEEINQALELSGRERSEITLIAVTKNFPVSDIEILYDLGIREFGENRDQEAREKVRYFQESSHHQFESMRWHFQGQLQRNKLASISSWAHMVHSVDDKKYLKGLSEGAVKNGRNIQCLIQISLDEYPTAGRGGTDVAGAREIIATFEREQNQLLGITLAGVMGVAPLNKPPAEAFSRLAEIYAGIGSGSGSGSGSGMKILSAGMSGDFHEAILAGATHLRIGSSILGSR